MGYAIGSLPARVISSGNPITQSVTPLLGEAPMVVGLRMGSGTDRAGGALTFADASGVTRTLSQAGSTQKAAASPEVGAELWYLDNPFPGTGTLTIPNTGALSIAYQVAFGVPKAGGRSKFLTAWGSNNTSTNPTCGTGLLGEPNTIVFAIMAGGHQDVTLISAQTGTIIHEVDDGNFGSAMQYLVVAAPAAQVMNWTHGTSDDWGACAAAFSEIAPHGFNNYMAAKGNINSGDRIR